MDWMEFLNSYLKFYKQHPCGAICSMYPFNRTIVAQEDRNLENRAYWDDNEIAPDYIQWIDYYQYWYMYHSLLVTCNLTLLLSINRDIYSFFCEWTFKKKIIIITYQEKGFHINKLKICGAISLCCVLCSVILELQKVLFHISSTEFLTIHLRILQTMYLFYNFLDKPKKNP